ncbi:MAG: FeoA family protein [Candidatus Sumerlaeota bacterium]
MPSTKTMLPLSQAKTGDRLMVVKLQGGRRLASRLADMGIFPGAVLNVVQSLHAGPAIISIRGERMALGRGMADKVLVKNVD